MHSESSPERLVNQGKGTQKQPILVAMEIEVQGNTPIFNVITFSY